ncbi:4Fe-4S binding protein [Agathobaculum sp. TL06]
MTTQEILTTLQADIHSTVFATLDAHGLPQTCVIDLMLADAAGLYFLTARGKAFYARLTAKPFVALTGMKGRDTLSTLAISLRGAVRSIGKQRLAEIFEKNPYMAKIYPTEKSRDALEVFQIYKGEGEYFDLGQLPPYRQCFSFGGGTARESGYRIDPDKCIGCQGCRSVCPAGCISASVPRSIDPAHCLHCGNCYRICPAGAVERRGG